MKNPKFNMPLTHPHIADRIASEPFFSPQRAQIARAYRLREYIDYCETHGATAFDTRSERCVECLRDDRTLPRADARRLGFPTFWDYCDDHGWCGHYVSVHKCAQCFTTAGIRRNPRTDVNPARVEARKAGRPRFVATCARHGATDHHVQTGKCLTCFNAMGYPRP